MRRRGFLELLMTLPLIRWVWEDKPKLNFIGTQTGRFSSKHPNLSNIPRGEHHCPRYPCMFEAGHEGSHQGILAPGEVYVWSDPEYIGKFTNRPIVGFDRILGKEKKS